MSPATLTFPEIKTDLVALDGGLDQLTPVLRLKAGVPRDAVNVECNILGGKGRIGGYERFDGRTKPSSATYSIVQVESFVATPVVGQTLTGMTTGTTGLIIAQGENYLVLTLLVGAGFSITEQVQVGAVLIGQATEVTAKITSLLNAQYLNLSADVYRAFIGAVPGSGKVWPFSMNLAGVHTVFAFRDNAGATASVLFKSSTSGWATVAYLNEVLFTAGGTAVPNDGDTLTQGANTATIKRVMLESGSWAAGTAAGRLIVTTPAPGNFAAGAGTAGAVGVTLSGVQTAITMLPGGRFEFDAGNFSGQASTLRIYGCDKANRMFEFDGVTLAPIKSALAVDKPTHLKVHQSHLFYSYGSSVLHSGIGTPFTHTATSGAAEYPMGATVFGFAIQPGIQNVPALLVTGDKLLKIMYGSAAGGNSPFQLVNYNSEAGAVEYSVQNMDRTYFVSTQGLIDLTRIQGFGNFVSSTLTLSLSTFMNDKRSLILCSVVHRDKNQYRFFCSDGSGLYATIVNQQAIGSMPVFFPNPVTSIWVGSLANGNEVQYFGSTNGFVYEMEKGSSFDGASIDWYMTGNWDSKKSPRVIKDYRGASLEMQGDFYASVDFEFILGYGSPEYEQQGIRAYESAFQGAPKWDSGLFWDAFVWDGATQGPTECEMSGGAENFRFRLSGSSDYMYPFSMSSLITHFIPRRLMRL